MLVGTTDGLLICDKAMTKIIKVIDENSTKDNVALKSNWIVFIKSFHNWLMVGTVGDGIFLMDTETLDCVAKVNIDNGLSDNVAVSMEADPYGNAWLTSFNGINIIDKNLNVVNTVYEHDGLSNREFSSFANVTVNGSFYFGTNNGVSIIDPVKYLNRESSKGIVIEDIEAISEEAKITKYHGYESNVVINEESSLVNINLTFPDYFNYNIGSAESELAIDSEINYTIKDENLIISEPDVGQYSINITNTKNTKSKSIDLIVKRTFPWTLIFSILGIGLLSYLISRYYVKLNRTKEAEKTEYNKKISELQLNALKAQMNPHFIFNAPLVENAINHGLYNLKKLKKMKVKTILIDDEDKNRQVIKLKLENNCPEIEIVGMAASAPEAYQLIIDKKPDLIFLDISMPGESGFEMLKRFTQVSFEIIFVTGYNDYALDALKVSAIDYLLKPVLDIDLINAVQKAKLKIRNKSKAERYEILQHNLNNIGDQDTKLAIPGTQVYNFVQIKDIIRCEGWQKYTRIHFVDGSQIVSSYNLGVYKELLANYGFYVCHKSHIINMSHISKYYKEGKVEMSNGSQVPVSRRKKDEFLTTVLDKIMLN